MEGSETISLGSEMERWIWGHFTADFGDGADWMGRLCDVGARVSGGRPRRERRGSCGGHAPPRAPADAPAHAPARSAGIRLFELQWKSSGQECPAVVRPCPVVVQPLSGVVQWLSSGCECSDARVTFSSGHIGYTFGDLRLVFQMA
jgi:hypothetical protein